MPTTSDDLLRIARQAAEKLDFSKRGLVPPLEDVEEACEAEIEEMLAVLQDEDVFGEVDLNAQQELADQIEAALPADRREMVAQLTDEHTRHVWLQQEAAYHLGVAVGMKMVAGKSPEEVEAMLDARQEAEDEEDRE